MPKVMMYKQNGTEAGEITLAEDVFGAEVNADAIRQVVIAQLAAERQGTQSALTRSEVRGGGIKPWRQKGTGRARQGSIRAPQWTGGGVVFAPKPRDYSVKVNKKVRKLAMCSALSDKVSEGSIIVLDALALEAGKTKEMVSVLSDIKAEGKALIITAIKDELVVRAANNLPGVKTTIAGAASVYDIVNCDKLVITEEAARRFEEVYA